MSRKVPRSPIGTYAHHERHWFYVRKRHLKKAKHTTREILVGQIIAVSGAIIAGFVLDLNKTELAAMAGAFLVLPGIFDLGGSVSGAMGARINHRAAQGAPIWQVFRDSLLHAFMLVCFSAVFLSMFAAGLGMWLFNADFWRLFMTSFLAVLTASAIGMPLVALLTVFAIKRGVDADNFIGPIETSIFDTLTIVTMTAMVVVLI